ncbi:DUF6957 family protein [Pseudomonas guineae]|uniref:DUF6957 family protein n=1 Tax=Pseudomonas guineae TaxID=425504 RepID=UPI003D00D921
MISLELWRAKFESVYGPGEIIQGSDMLDSQAMQYARERFPDSKYCIVRTWVWFDLDVSDDQRKEMLEKHGAQPSFIRADRVVFDSKSRFEQGDWVRTSALHSFEEGFLFRTSNTVYMLLGIGYRAHAMPGLIREAAAYDLTMGA